MSRFCAILAALALALTPALARADDYLESVSTSTTSAVTAKAYEPGWYAVQCTAATRYRTCATATCTATANDQSITAGQVFDIYTPSYRAFFAFINDSGTGTCRLYRALWQQRF